ncbi:PAS domain-containing protein [Alcaligenaceae bacterium]|nr:PAS domain-containing protein [Alcaligenaceae bacterium]
MRKNFPVYNTETRVREDQYLISKTDTKGRITYANPTFHEISGFTQEELLGKAHNIVRHPDMPPAVYKDFWDTVSQGKPWMGVVKNRSKDGGFYWMLANATPTWNNGTLTGYASVRVRPSDEQIAQAEALYEDINAGRSNGYTVKGGQRVRAGWRRIFNVLALPFADTLKAGMARAGALAATSLGISMWFAVQGGFPPGEQAWWLSAVAVLALVALGYGWVVTQRIIRPLEGVANIARQVASGNLDIPIDNTQRGEVGNLYFYLDLMRKSLISIANDVELGISAASQATHTLHANNDRLSERTHQQASSLAQTATSMEQLTATVRQTADNAHQATQLTAASMKIAQHGGKVVNEVVTTMKDMHDSSRKIGDIVTMIEGIAFQTNILALNAAVESARAGEAGRGFAVVAGEVRNLAQRSAAAATDIKALIDDSVQRMTLGSEQASRAGLTMQEIVESVHRVTDIMDEISTATAEQTTGLEQINQAIGKIDSATHNNAQMVEDLGQTIDTLAYETEILHQAISVLNTGKGAAQQASAQRTPPVQLNTLNGSPLPSLKLGQQRTANVLLESP